MCWWVGGWGWGCAIINVFDLGLERGSGWVAPRHLTYAAVPAAHNLALPRDAGGPNRVESRVYAAASCRGGASRLQQRHTGGQRGLSRQRRQLEGGSRRELRCD
jgi:hypothetical protein